NHDRRRLRRAVRAIQVTWRNAWRLRVALPGRGDYRVAVARSEIDFVEGELAVRVGLVPRLGRGCTGACECHVGTPPIGRYCHGRKKRWRIEVARDHGRMAAREIQP